MLFPIVYLDHLGEMLLQTASIRVLESSLVVVVEQLDLRGRLEYQLSIRNLKCRLGLLTQASLSDVDLSSTQHNIYIFLSVRQKCYFVSLYSLPCCLLFLVLSSLLASMPVLSFVRWKWQRNQLVILQKLISRERGIKFYSNIYISICINHLVSNSNSNCNSYLCIF